MLLKITGLEKRYTGEGRSAVHDLGLSVVEGEILALLGESGSGKTTLLRLIAGFERQDAGEICIGEEVVASPNIFVQPEHRKVGMVFQEYALFPHLTVEANIQFGLHNWKRTDREARLQEVLQWVNIQGLEKKYPHQLSGGQQQRVALARALAPQPSLLLLDEPFSNLDVQLKDQVREEVRRTIKLAGTTAIFVTHDVKDALSTADSIAVLKDGQLQQLGTPEQLYQSPTNVYVANFFGKINLLKARQEGSGFHTALGFLAGTVGANRGFSGLICVRPEEIEICPSHDSSMKGKIASIHYFGDHLQLLLEVNTELRLWVKAPTNVEYSPGETFHFRIKPGNFRLLDSK